MSGGLDWQTSCTRHASQPYWDTAPGRHFLLMIRRGLSGASWYKCSQSTNTSNGLFPSRTHGDGECAGYWMHWLQYQHECMTSTAWDPDGSRKPIWARPGVMAAPSVTTKTQFTSSWKQLKCHDPDRAFLTLPCSFFLLSARVPGPINAG